LNLKGIDWPREALAQAIDYASDVAGWDIDHFRENLQIFYWAKPGGSPARKILKIFPLKIFQ